MVFNALLINSHIFSEECKCKKKNPFGRRKVKTRALASAECELRVSADHRSPSHWPSSGDVWVQACNVWLPQCPSYSMNAVVHIGKQRLSKPRDCHQILTSFPTKRRPVALSTVRKVWMVRSTRAGARKLFERIVRRRRDMPRPIPYRTRSTVSRPASGHSCRPTSLQWRTRRTAFKSSLPALLVAVVSAAACNSAGRWDWARLAAQVTWRSTSTLSVPGPAVAVYKS